MRPEALETLRANAPLDALNEHERVIVEMTRALLHERRMPEEMFARVQRRNSEISGWWKPSGLVRALQFYQHGRAHIRFRCGAGNRYILRTRGNPGAAGSKFKYKRAVSRWKSSTAGAGLEIRRSRERRYRFEQPLHRMRSSVPSWAGISARNSGSSNPKSVIV